MKDAHSFLIVLYQEIWKLAQISLSLTMGQGVLFAPFIISIHKTF